MKAVAVAAVLSPAFALASPRLGLDVESGATHVLMSRDPLIENSCKDLSLSSDHTVLNGQCLNSKNQWQSTSIGLSTCIANNDGVLRPARG
ncbi:hypothetical protein UVI_02042920 [Ustilaginoidea virens]|uniref:Cyanovirin-N domain-containing protein n=1 Tax=Ustilaginoidea virens TaxID=1159556 RepID=A0A1B5L3I6_USTVR|nr:hypothetical protein UVI_02042920 [Ustilaginoidea virens]